MSRPPDLDEAETAARGRHQELYELIHGYQAGQLMALTAEDPDPEELARLDIAVDAAVDALDGLPPPPPAQAAALAELAREAARLAAAVAEATRQRRDELTAQQQAQERSRERLGGYLPTADPIARYIDRRS